MQEDELLLDPGEVTYEGLMEPEGELPTGVGVILVVLAIGVVGLTGGIIIRRFFMEM